MFIFIQCRYIFICFNRVIDSDTKGTEMFYFFYNFKCINGHNILEAKTKSDGKTAVGAVKLHFRTIQFFKFGFKNRGILYRR